MYKVAAVIDDDIGADLEHFLKALLILLHRAAVLGEYIHAAAYQRCGNIVLS